MAGNLALKDISQSDLNAAKRYCQERLLRIDAACRDTLPFAIQSDNALDTGGTLEP